MDYVRLGKTGLKVSRICLGCMTYGVPERGTHPWTLDEEASRPFIKQALELGINFFDTANIYSDGTSEEIVGRALRDFAKRDEIVLATKVYCRMRPGPNGGGLSRKAIFTEIDASLQRLGTDYVDLYQIHRWDDDDADRGDAGGAARRGEGRQGALYRRLLDVSPGSSPRRSTPPTLTAGPASSACRTISTCSIARRSARCCRCARTEGIGVIPWSPLARGRLTRDWSETSQALGDRRVRPHALRRNRRMPTARSSNASPRSPQARGVPRAQVALAWVLAKPGVTAPIIGATKPHHLTDAVAAAALKLSAEEIAALEEPYVPHEVAGIS